MVASGVLQRQAVAAANRATAERARASFDANGNPLYPVDEPITALNIERAPPLTIPNDLRTMNDMMGGLSLLTVGAGSAGTVGNGGQTYGATSRSETLSRQSAPASLTSPTSERHYSDNSLAGWDARPGAKNIWDGTPIAQLPQTDVGEVVVVARPKVANGSQQSNAKGGFYADFGLGLGAGFNLHIDRRGVTASVGAGVFGRADVGYAFSERALEDVSQENKLFFGAKAGKSNVGYGAEYNYKNKQLSGVVGPVKVTTDGKSLPELETAFDVGKYEGSPALKASSKAVSFGFDAGIGWLHTLGRR